MKFISIMIVLFLSPLWPLGENPAPNAPFLIVKKQTNQIAYVDDREIQNVYRVATGATNELTPNGLHTITVKAKEPYYRKKNIPGGSPDNPLGSRWIGFDAEDTDGRIYGVHGTNKPESIGANVSAGCIRMMNENVEVLFDRIPIGTKILITESEEDFTTIAKQYNAM
ncbi:L,D-transpeptidase [Aquibacillus koreensis]|uniref:L,D-transpeptidase n=1 Tax=Aquibacillus koreensis TaxID=279446 RepID=A0A9X4AGG4_9BACI|nr:L,D-transpeptidase [Aquibacillus koreensis]MCT2537470.1 L,D-transpeptidase [Aquibacillus koreensis]MDC3418916.1 L,D-transpeptidase [Aquibacillus koreensis]